MANRVQVLGLDELLRKLGGFGLNAVHPAIAEVATHIKSVIARFPPQITRRKQPFKTDKQRRFFFAALHEGRIEVPYRRGISPGSEGMGRRWTIQFRDNGLTAIVGNNASYVNWVHDPEDQTHFHQQGGWKTSRQIVDERSNYAQQILSKHYRRWERGA